MKKKTIIIGIGAILLVSLAIAQIAGGAFNVTTDREIRQTIEEDFGTIHLDRMKCDDLICHGWILRDDSNKTVGFFEFKQGKSEQETRESIIGGVEQWMKMYVDSKDRIDPRVDIAGGNVVISDR